MLVEHEGRTTQWQQPSARMRAIIAVIVGCVAAVVCWRIRPDPSYPEDFIWALRTSRNVINGIDPYTFPPVQPGNPPVIPYPLPIIVVGIPLLLFSDGIAASLFFGISSGILAYGITREGWWRLLLFGSTAMYAATRFVQWSPLICAMAMFGSLLPLILIKPQIALPMMILKPPSKRGIILTGAILLLSLLIAPTWIQRWIGLIGDYERIIPLLALPTGPLLLLVAFAYKDRRAMFLLALSLMPQRALYDVLGLWLLPRTRTQMLLLTTLSWLGLITNSYQIVVQQWIVNLLYLPVAAMILWDAYRDRQAASLQEPT